MPVVVTLTGIGIGPGRMAVAEFGSDAMVSDELCCKSRCRFCRSLGGTSCRSFFLYFLQLDGSSFGVAHKREFWKTKDGEYRART